jgi:hypothetical protein
MSKNLKKIYTSSLLALQDFARVATYRHCEPRRGVATPKGSSLCRPIKAGVIIHKRYYAQILLILLLAMPSGCSCFPDKSQVIEKEREWDINARKLMKVYVAALENYKKELPKVKDRIKNLNQLTIDTAKEQQLKKECRNFLQQFYLPYLSAWQPYEAHVAKHEGDRSKKAQAEKLARDIASHIRYVRESLLHENDTSKLCKFILELKELKSV